MDTIAGLKYPNQQLRAVSLEVFFPGRLAAYAVLGQVQDAVAHRLPNLFVPNLQPGEAAALRPFQLRDASQKRSLAIAVNQATYISFDYPGAEAFLDEALGVLGKALDLLSPGALTRVTYRYENELGVSRASDGSVALEKFFPGVLPLGNGPVSCASIDSKVERKWQREATAGTVGHHARIELESGLDVVRVSVFASVHEPAVTDLRNAAGVAHENAFDHFEKIISDEFRGFISQGGSP